MSELENLVRGLSNKVDGIQKDLDNLKKRSGKRKKHGKCHSRRHHRHQSPSESRSRSRLNSREESHSWRENPRERSRSRSASSPRRGTRGRHDRCSESPSCTRNNSPPNTQLSWDNVPDTPQYDEVTDWGDDLAAGSHSIPPTNVATVSEETEILIKDACTVRLEHANRLKIRNTYSLPQVAASRTPQLDNYLKPEIPAAAKTTDKELAVIQTHILDALALLSTII